MWRSLLLKSTLLLNFVADIHCYVGNDSISTSTTTQYLGVQTLLETSCDTIVFSTQTLTGSPSGTTTIFITIPVNQTAQRASLAPREVYKRSVVWTTIIVPSLTFTISSTCTALFTVTQPGQKITVTSFIPAQAQVQTTISTIITYESTTTIQPSQCNLETGFSSTMTEPPTTVTTITVITGGPLPAANKMARETKLVSLPRELKERDLVTIYTTITLPALTSTEVSLCVTTDIITLPGEKITVTSFVPYIGSSGSDSTSSSTATSSASSSSTPSSQSITTTAFIPQTQSNAPTQTGAEIATAPPPTPLTTPFQTIQAEPSITTTIGTSLVTIISLPGGPSALVNNATLSVGGLATTIDSVVFTFASSGLLAISESTSPPSPIFTSFTFETILGSTLFKIVELPGKAIVDGTTLSAGGPDATINGVEVTYAATGLIAVPTSGTTVGLGGIIMSIFSYTELASGSGVEIGTQTLTPGGVQTVSGTVYTLPTSGTVPVALSTQTPSQTSLVQFTGSAYKEETLLSSYIFVLILSVVQAVLVL